MKASLNWLNALLTHPAGSAPTSAAAPAPLSADRVEEILTFAGLPIESREPVTLADGSSDTRLDVEVTSNRGDCLCHAGLARELLAASGNPSPLLAQTPAPRIPATSSLPGIALENLAPAHCPRFTLRIIRGVKIAPSPAGMQARLEAIGQRPINNVVDCTNYVLHELGSPSHVFDLSKISGGRIIVRPAIDGEKLPLLDGRTVSLKPADIVVADAASPLSLAGVMGGSASAVSPTTTDILLEVATWNPVSIRGTARRLALRTDSSFRFERVVSPRSIDAAANRLVELILQTAGGHAEPGALDWQAPGACDAPPPVTLRLQRVRDVLGWPIDDARIASTLRAQAIAVEPAPSGLSLLCRPPADRNDIRLEIDLIEEVARTIGYAHIPQPETMTVRVAGLQQDQMAVRELARVLTGAGFFETVTFSFVSAKHAAPFTRQSTRTVGVSDDRRGAEGICRPSVLPSLLECRRLNQAARSAPDGSVRLYELSSTFAEAADAAKPSSAPSTATAPSLERRVLAILADLPSPGAKDLDRRQAGLRLVRGVIDELIENLLGPDARVTVEPAQTSGITGFDPAASAAVLINGQPIGTMGLIASAQRAQFDLAGGAGAVAAELDLAALIASYPPRRRVTPLPVFPAIERDLSLIVDEAVQWAAVQRSADAARTTHLRSLRFVGTYRGKPIPDGKKSVTLAMEFRDDARTLRDEEVNDQVATITAALTSAVGATVRQ